MLQTPPPTSRIRLLLLCLRWLDWRAEGMLSRSLQLSTDSIQGNPDELIDSQSTHAQRLNFWNQIERIAIPSVLNPVPNQVRAGIWGGVETLLAEQPYSPWDMVRIRDHQD